MTITNRSSYLLHNDEQLIRTDTQIRIRSRGNISELCDDGFADSNYKRQRCPCHVFNRLVNEVDVAIRVHDDDRCVSSATEAYGLARTDYWRKSKNYTPITDCATTNDEINACSPNSEAAKDRYELVVELSSEYM